jgi:hypothetical protein
MKKRKERTHCTQPDRDVPGIECGYPLPCPWHRATIDMTTDPPEVRIPVTVPDAVRKAKRLKRIAEVLALAKMSDEESENA